MDQSPAAGEVPTPETADLACRGAVTAVLVRRAWSVAVSLWNVLVSIFWFMLLVAWIWLLIRIFADLFQDHDLSGWGKALWALFLIVIPWLGALVYLIARGRAMNERALDQAARNEQAFRQYVQQAAASTPSTAEEVGKLADLRDRGTISQHEFEQAKARLLGTQTPETTNSHAAQPVARN